MAQQNLSKPNNSVNTNSFQAMTGFLLKQLSKRDQKIKRLNSENKLLKIKLRQDKLALEVFSQQVEEREQALQALAVKVSENEQEILFYVTSKSWRLTRSFRRLFRKLRNWL
jgi:hypothetical protein